MTNEKEEKTIHRRNQQMQSKHNVNGKEQVLGVHYEETYAPVVRWATIRFFMILVIINKWHTRQHDFVLAFPQADIERELYTRLPALFLD
jgi:hypothetical protein